jgi:outer membrane lipoprotein-sorting protein
MKIRTSVVLFFLAFLTSSVFAQDPKAKAILAEVSRKYRSYHVIRAEVSILAENPQSKTKDTRSGTLYVQSAANQYKLILPGREMTSDGKTLWTWLKEEKEVQVTDAVTDGEGINPAKIFLIYEKGYKYLLTGESKLAGRTIQTIELTPENTKQQWFKIRLGIDKLAKQIKTATLFDKNGSRYTYTVKNMTGAVKLAASFFSFNPKAHPGVEIVDLR